MARSSCRDSESLSSSCLPCNIRLFGIWALWWLFDVAMLPNQPYESLRAPKTGFDLPPCALLVHPFGPTHVLVPFFPPNPLMEVSACSTFQMVLPYPYHAARIAVSGLSNGPLWNQRKPRFELAVLCKCLNVSIGTSSPNIPIYILLFVLNQNFTPSSNELSHKCTRNGNVSHVCLSSPGAHQMLQIFSTQLHALCRLQVHDSRAIRRVPPLQPRRWL